MAIARTNLERQTALLSKSRGCHPVALQRAAPQCLPQHINNSCVSPRTHLQNCFGCYMACHIRQKDNCMPHYLTFVCLFLCGSYTVCTKCLLSTHHVMCATETASLSLLVFPLAAVNGGYLLYPTVSTCVFLCLSSNQVMT